MCAYRDSVSDSTDTDSGSASAPGVPSPPSSSKRHIQFKTESYVDQKKKYWPNEGRHILAQYDDQSVVVYQAFRPEIAEYAVKNQKFGGDHYSFERMSWTKTNFLWMMYRCGWASKKEQQRVLAIWIPRPAFEEILANAYTAGLQKSKKMTKDDITVRLQWDPDHTPNFTKCARRAIQLGMKGEILRKFGTEWPLQIQDITKFVREQHNILNKKGEDHILTPCERVYHITDSNLATQISLDIFEPAQKAVVVKGFQRQAAAKGGSQQQSVPEEKSDDSLDKDTVQS